MPKVFLSGPITGVEHYERPFNAAQALAESQGYEVFNPATLPPGHDWTWYMRRCVEELAKCDHIWMLPGWMASRGSPLEHRIAGWLSIKPRYLKPEEVGVDVVNKSRSETR